MEMQDNKGDAADVPTSLAPTDITESQAAGGSHDVVAATSVLATQDVATEQDVQLLTPTEAASLEMAQESATTENKAQDSTSPGCAASSEDPAARRHAEIPKAPPDCPMDDAEAALTSTVPPPAKSASCPTKDVAIQYDYDEADGWRVLRLRPSREQWTDFPSILAFARKLGAERDGCFKVVIPDELQEPLPHKPAQNVEANAYRVKQMRRTTFWQVSTVPAKGMFSSTQPDESFTESVDLALKNLKHLFRKQRNRQLRNIRYRVDVPAWTKTQRRLAGVPEQSPIYPLKGDKLDHTKAVIPGIHTPYVYESAPYFGATFQIHAEDFRLASLNHLYKGRKIWIVIPATAVDVAEAALGRGAGCSQFMRHRAEFFFPDKLAKLGIPYRIVDQRPGETMVILPDAYHEGFSCGYTLAEAKNYADTEWTTASYQPCHASCRLATAIPAAFLKPLEEGEQRLDLCAAYGDDISLPNVVGAPPSSLERNPEAMEGYLPAEAELIKV